jgi:hypothetical protein
LSSLRLPLKTHPKEKFMTYAKQLAVFVVVAVTAMCATRFANAETVWAQKDCSVTPCVVTGSTNPVGWFRIDGPDINWSATYLGTPQRFWVSQGGSNMADIQLSTANGDLGGGPVSLSSGVWFISVRTGLMGWGNYSMFGANVHGDTHVMTTNGIAYDFQGVGEFVLLKKSNYFEVQSRMMPVAAAAPLPPEPHTGLSSCPSINTAAAVKTVEHRVTYQPRLSGQPDPTGMELRIDGVLTAVSGTGITLSDKTRISQDPETGELRIIWGNGAALRITPTWWDAKQTWYLDYDFTPPERSAGIAGAIPSDGWLPLLADGSSLGAKPALLGDRYKALYVTFADSWRVRDSTSLFDYAPGTSTKTYTMRAWPGEDGKCEVPFTVPVQGVSLEVAEQACKGVVVPHMKQSCIQDVAATGNLGFGKGYLVSEGLPVSKSTAPAGNPKETGGRAPNSQY